MTTTRTADALRDLRLLEAFAAPGAPPTTEALMAASGLPDASLRRALARLAATRWLVADATAPSGHALGPAALTFANRVLHALPIESGARAVLRDLVAATGETATLNRLLPREGLAMIAAIEASDRPLGYAFEVGEVKRLHPGASGNAILAFLPIEARRRALEGGASIGAAQLAAIRRQGYAESEGARVPGAHGLAAPVFAPGREVWGSVVLTIPAHGFVRARRDVYVAALLRAASSIGRLLGAGEAA